MSTPRCTCCECVMPDESVSIPTDPAPELCEMCVMYDSDAPTEHPNAGESRQETLQ